MEDDEEWRPEDSNSTDELTTDELKRLASEIGINYGVKKRSQNVTSRPRRARKKTAHFVPSTKLRDFRGEKEERKRKQRKQRRAQRLKLKSFPSKRKTNSFGGVDTKRQRAVFGGEIVQSVHRPLDVYKGGGRGSGLTWYICISVYCIQHFHLHL